MASVIGAGRGGSFALRLAHADNRPAAMITALIAPSIATARARQRQVFSFGARADAKDIPRRSAGRAFAASPASVRLGEHGRSTVTIRAHRASAVRRAR